MNIIVLLNFTSLFFALLCVGVLINKQLHLHKGDVKLWYIILSFIILAFAIVTNVMEHMGITEEFDIYEDQLEVLFIPMFIFSILSYGLKIEAERSKTYALQIEADNAKLNMALESASEGLWEWDHENQELIILKDKCFLSFNPFAYTISSLNWEQMVHIDSNNQYRSFMDALAKDEVLPDNVEILLKSIDGTFHWVLFRGNCNTEEKTSTALFRGTLVDINTLKKNQVDLINAKLKAEEGDRLKDTFINNLSHEIRTPMNAILGFSELLVKQDCTLDEQKKYVHIITKSTHQLLNIIQDLLDISHITIGTLQVFRTMHDIIPILNDLNRKYSLQACEKGLEFNFTTDIENSFLMYTDNQKLLRIIETLLDNALKFTHSGSVDFNFVTKSSQVEFTVKDTGIGIHNDNLNEIFKKFRKLNKDATKVFGGTGLGLSICNGFIHALGGEINIKSEIDRGTEISVILPTDKPNNIKNNEAKLNKDVVKGKKLIIAEDEDSNFEYLRIVLQDYFSTILHAENGQKAIDLFQQNRDTSLILMDIMMPIMNGTEATKKIKEIDSQILVIAQTAFLNQGDVDNLNNELFDAFLSKPIRKEQLLAAINRGLKSSAMS